MITLHELHERGGDISKAVAAFGGLHPQSGDGPNRPFTPDWKLAERHFRTIQALLMGRPELPTGSGRREQERRAQNAATGLLLAIDADAGHRCPVCILRAPDA